LKIIGIAKLQNCVSIMNYSIKEEDWNVY